MSFSSLKTSVDVIIPTYNRCYVLWRAIQSVLSQDFPFFHLIIIDDGSIDQTKQLINFFHDPRIEYYSIPHGGSSAARNFGIKQGKSSYIAYLDSDNTWTPYFLSSMISALEKNKGKILAYCGINYSVVSVNSDGKEDIVLQRIDKPHSVISVEELWERTAILDTNQVVHRRNVFNSIGYWDEKLTALVDWDFTLRLARSYPGKFFPVHKTMVNYVRKVGIADSISANMDGTTLARAIYDKHGRVFKTKPIWVTKGLSYA